MAGVGHKIPKVIRESLEEIVPEMKEAIEKIQVRYARHLDEVARAMKHADESHVLQKPHSNAPLGAPSPNGKGPHASGNTVAVKRFGVGVDRGDGRDMFGQWAKGHGKPQPDPPKFLPSPNRTGPHVTEHGDVIRRRWTPAHAVGPLGEKYPADTFRTNSYNEVQGTGPRTMYRTVGEGGNPLGHFWTLEKPTGPLQAQLDNAIMPEWKLVDPKAERLVTAPQATHYQELLVPEGIVWYEGPAGPQTGKDFPGSHLDGGGEQVYLGLDEDIPPSWKVGGLVELSP